MLRATPLTLGILTLALAACSPSAPPQPEAAKAVPAKAPAKVAPVVTKAGPLPPLQEGFPYATVAETYTAVSKGKPGATTPLGGEIFIDNATGEAWSFSAKNDPAAPFVIRALPPAKMVNTNVDPKKSPATPVIPAMQVLCEGPAEACAQVKNRYANKPAAGGPSNGLARAPDTVGPKRVDAQGRMILVPPAKAMRPSFTAPVPPPPAPPAATTLPAAAPTPPAAAPVKTP